ncbi:Protein Simiate [Portunus trituberculatus]|uniref:Protein Abitram n=1 Tax=Portunus trituberculatus TaxID=210409 RepID=A0A5B7F0J4_PORTR|nr:Protein Simiate [Portunus trituberculatus]
MLPPAMEGKIEDTVDLNLQYPSVSERYWTKYYFIPKEKKKPGTNGEEKGSTKEGGGEMEKGMENAMKEDDTEKMDVDLNHREEKDDRLCPAGEGTAGHSKMTYSSLDSSGHVCVMVHTNKLCLVTLSARHPALAPGQEITQVSYEVGKFNRLDNQVSGKGKRGAQMMGPQSPVCIITCADSSRHLVLAGVHGKLVEVNERLLANPKLLSERPDAEGYVAVILPPIKNGDGPLRRLITAEQYQEMYSSDVTSSHQL